MTESRIQVGLSQEYLETSKLITDAGEVHREGVFTGDPDNADAKTKVTNSTPGSDDYGTVVRPIIDSTLPVSDTALLIHLAGAQEELLQKIVGELKVMNHHLALISDDTEVEPEDLYGDER